MEKLFACKAKSNKNLAPVKRMTISTEKMEVQEMYGHSNMHMDEKTKLRETVAKG
jgi:hypothetical protein